MLGDKRVGPYHPVHFAQKAATDHWGGLLSLLKHILLSGGGQG